MRKMRLRFMHTIFILKLMLYGLFATKTFSSTRKFKELFHETIYRENFYRNKNVHARCVGNRRIIRNDF